MPWMIELAVLLIAAAADLLYVLSLTAMPLIKRMVAGAMSAVVVPLVLPLANV
jgi:hypothetical protein